MARGQQIVYYHLGAPPAWGHLPLEPLHGPEGGAIRQEIAALAADLTVTAEGAERLERELLRAQPSLSEPDTLSVAVWVPDAETGSPVAHLVVELFATDGATPDDFVAGLDRTPGPGQTILRLDIERITLPVGEAVVIDSIGSEEGGELEQVLTYLVFPTGSDDGLSLTFASSALDLDTELAEAARAIAETLTVTLGTA